MMTQYQMFFMFNYASSDYYRTIEIFSGMMPALRTKMEQVSCVTFRTTTAPAITV